MKSCDSDTSRLEFERLIMSHFKVFYAGDMRISEYWTDIVVSLGYYLLPGSYIVMYAVSHVAIWPSGLRRQNQDLVRKGEGSNPSVVIYKVPPVFLSGTLVACVALSCILIN